jgi:competence protein ComEC
VIGAIWLYALITGMSPSVTRASLMFSILQSGKLMRNPPPTTNTLAASALIILLINPLLLANIGFQFSYLAVLAIVNIMPFQKMIWQPSNIVISNLWSLVFVSLAAQLGTGPLAIHYFHQFPVWFLLTNIIVIPLTSIIIYLAVVVLTIPFPMVYELVGYLLSFCLDLMAGSVQFVENLPGSVVSSVNMPAFGTILVYLIFFLIFIIVHSRSKRYVSILLFTVVLFLTYVNVSKWRACTHKELFVYDIRGNTVVDFFDGRSCLAFYDEDEVKPSSISYSITPNRISSGIQDHKIRIIKWDTLIVEKDVFIDHGFISVNGRQILVVDDDYQPGGNLKCDLDVLIVTGSYKGTITELSRQLSFNELIIDSSVPPWNLQKYEEECRDLGVRWYTTRKMGCFTSG